MNKLALVFPGQGSQYVGMGKEAREQSQRAAAIFAEADAALGISLTALCENGPEDTLRLTTNAQPAILTTSIAILEWLKEEVSLTPSFVAGHSLGEYSALVAAGAMNFSDAVVAVRARGSYMEEAVPAGEGTMAAVLGMDREILGAICKEVTQAGEAVQLANLNSPGQIVISGSTVGVQKAGEEAKSQGAKRVIPLNVSGPFHSILLKPAAEKLAEKLAALAINDAQVPVVTNVSARAITGSGEIYQSLVDQVFSSVLWEDSVRFMIDQGMDTFIEVGPGNVLSGLIKKIDRNVRAFSIQDMASLTKFKSEWT
jgi:[acyl-carrier-protein] S-malonyltransferase